MLASNKLQSTAHLLQISINSTGPGDHAPYDSGAHQQGLTLHPERETKPIIYSM